MTPLDVGVLFALAVVVGTVFGAVSAIIRNDRRGGGR